MKYRIDKENGKPAYLQLYEQLKRDILNGIFAYGARLPSKRLLAAETGLSVIPVERAYGLLCDEGYAEARERSGYFAIYRIVVVSAGGHDLVVLLRPHFRDVVVGIVAGVSVEHLDAVHVVGIHRGHAPPEGMPT